MNTFRTLIDQWPSRGALGEDLKIAAGTVQQWWNRQSIPPEHWTALIKAAEKRGIEGVTAGSLADIAARQKRKPPSDTAPAPSDKKPRKGAGGAAAKAA